MLENILEDQNAYERRDTIIFSGDAVPTSTTGENCVNVIQNLVRDKLRLEVHVGEFNIAHRLGKKPTTQAPDKRSLIVKLCRREMKHEIMSACKSLSFNSHSGSPSLYVN